MTRLSIRARLTVAFAMAMVLVLAAVGLFVYLRVSNDLTDVIDEGLAVRADDVAALVASGDGRVSALGGGRLVEGEDGFSQILTVDGRVLASTLSPDVGSTLSGAALARAAQGSLPISERAVPGVSGDARILARPVGSNQGARVVVVGATNEDRTEALAGLRHAFFLGAPAALLLTCLLGHLLAGRALGPVASMRRRASEITLEQTGERLPLPRAKDEIRSLGETLNEMLDRIEASLERERVFVADASHELRTPLANLRMEIELADRQERSAAELRESLRSAGEEVDRLSQLAADLLVLARSDDGRLPIDRQSVPLTSLLERVEHRFAGRAAEAGRRISIDAPAKASAKLDPVRTEQAIANLVDNALRHGRGEVHLTARTTNGRVVFDVSDEGLGFDREFQEHAFERFTRGDAGRSGGGTGLGLAITRAIAQAQGGDARIAGDVKSGTTVSVSLPL